MAIYYGETVLGIRDIYDPDQPVAIVWLNRSLVELSESDKKSRWRKPIAAGVAIKDFDKLATQLKADPDGLPHEMWALNQECMFHSKERK